MLRLSRARPPSGPAQFLRAAGGGDFSTNFPSVENPLSQGGIWTNGLADGANWNNAQVTANGAVGASDTFYLTQRYADDIAHLKSSYRAFNANQFAQATVYRAGGYTGNGGKHEIELLLRFDITSGNARGYELAMGMDAGTVYAFIVRWNGGLGNYTALADPGNGLGSYLNDGPFLPVDGDVIRAEISGTTLTLKQNGSAILSATDNTFATGQPGIGFWPVDGAIATSLGWKNYQAGDL